MAHELTPGLSTICRDVTVMGECLDCDAEVIGPLCIEPWEKDGVPGFDIGILSDGRAHRILIIEVRKAPPKGNGNAIRPATPGT
jgi:hypothetical protein